MIFWINILKVFFKSNSVSINKKNHIDIKCSLLNKTLHSVKSEIFSTKLWRKLTKFYPMTIISSDHENEIHLPCLRILKMIRRNKWFNPPDYITNYVTYSYHANIAYPLFNNIWVGHQMWYRFTLWDILNQ